MQTNFIELLVRHRPGRLGTDHRRPVRRSERAAESPHPEALPRAGTLRAGHKLMPPHP